MLYTGKESVKLAVLENDTIVIMGETGSGKTTRKHTLIVVHTLQINQLIPQIYFESLRGPTVPS